MLYCSRNMVRDRCNFHFYPPNNPKMKISEEWKKHLEVSSFNTSVPKTMIICFTVLEIWLLFWFWAICFALLHPNSSKNQNFSKMKKNAGRYHHLHKCTKIHDQMLHCSWDMVLEDTWNYFSHWAIFSPFIPLTAQKMKILKVN